jgi:hypothetical protein
MQYFDRPVAAEPVGELSWAGLGGGQVGDGVDGDGGPAAGGQVEPPAADPQSLGGVREVQRESAGAGDRLQAADVVAAVTAFAGLVLYRDLRPGQGFELPVQPRLVLLHGEQVAGVFVLAQPAGVVALGV